MFLDIDDMIDVNLLNNMQKYIDRDIEMIKYKMKIIKDNTEILADGPVFDVTDGQEAFNNLCFKDKFLDSPCLYLIKKELIERTNMKFEKNVYHEDFGLMPSLIVNAISFVSTDFYGYYYFQTDDSIMRNSNYSKKKEKVNDKFLLYTNLLKKLDEYHLLKKTKENLLEYYTNSIIIAIQGLKVKDRIDFEKKIKRRGLIKNIKVRNFRLLIKKLALKVNMELYFLLLKFEKKLK